MIAVVESKRVFLNHNRENRLLKVLARLAHINVSFYLESIMILRALGTPGGARQQHHHND